MNRLITAGRAGFLLHDLFFWEAARIFLIDSQAAWDKLDVFKMDT